MTLTPAGMWHVIADRTPETSRRSVDWIGVLADLPTASYVDTATGATVDTTHAKFFVDAFQTLIGNIPVKWAEINVSGVVGWDWSYIENPYKNGVFGLVGSPHPIDYLSAIYLRAWKAAKDAGITGMFGLRMMPVSLDTAVTPHIIANHFPHECHTVNGSATVTKTVGSNTPFVMGAYTADGDVGRPIHGPGIPDGATVLAVNSATSLTMSAPANATSPSAGVLLTIDGDFGMGALGMFNAHFHNFAQNLADAGFGDAIIRIDSEFAMPWASSGEDRTTPQEWVGYWKQIVNTMRAVSPDFKFFWNPARGGSSPTDATLHYDGIDIANWYPGDDYVDIVGLDFYNQYDNTAYNWPGGGDSWVGSLSGPTFTHGVSHTGALNEGYGLRWLAAFARNHNKPIAFGEWGISSVGQGGGNGGDHTGVTFIKNFAKWAADNNVIAANYFEDDSQSISLNHNPESLVEAKLDFGPYLSTTATGQTGQTKLPDNVLFGSQANDVTANTYLDGGKMYSDGWHTAAIGLRRLDDDLTITAGKPLGAFNMGGFYRDGRSHDLAAGSVAYATEDWDDAHAGAAMAWRGTPRGSVESNYFGSLDEVGFRVMNRDGYMPNAGMIVGSFNMADVAAVTARAAQDWSDTTHSVSMRWMTTRVASLIETEAARINGTQAFIVGNSGHTEQADLFSGTPRWIPNIATDASGFPANFTLTCTDPSSDGLPFTTDDIGKLVSGLNALGPVIPLDTRIIDVASDGKSCTISNPVTATVASNHAQTTIQLGAFGTPYLPPFFTAQSDPANYKTRTTNEYIGHYRYMPAGGHSLTADPADVTVQLVKINHIYDDDPGSQAAAQVPGPRAMLQWEGTVLIGPNVEPRDNMAGSWIGSGIAYGNWPGHDAFPGGLLTGILRNSGLQAQSGGKISVALLQGDWHQSLIGPAGVATGSVVVGDMTDVVMLDDLDDGATAGSTTVHNWIGYALSPPFGSAINRLDQATVIKIGVQLRDGSGRSSNLLSSVTTHTSGSPHDATAPAGTFTAPTNGTVVGNTYVGKQLLTVTSAVTAGGTFPMRFITAVGSDGSWADFNQPFTQNKTVNMVIATGLIDGWSSAGPQTGGYDQDVANAGVMNGMTLFQYGAAYFRGKVDFSEATIVGSLGGSASLLIDGSPNKITAGFSLVPFQGADDQPATFWFQRQNASRTISALNTLGQIYFAGRYSTGTGFGTGAAIVAGAAGDWLAGVYPGYLAFQTTPAFGSAPVNALILNSDQSAHFVGNVTIDGTLTAGGSTSATGWSRTKRVPATGTRVTASTAYVNAMPTDTVQLVNLVKKNAGTNLVVRVTGSQYATGAVGAAIYGVNFNGLDRDIARSMMNALLTHTAFAGAQEFAGVAAGTYTFTLRVKSEAAATTLNWNTEDVLSMSVEEVWPS